MRAFTGVHGRHIALSVRRGMALAILVFIAACSATPSASSPSASASPTSHPSASPPSAVPSPTLAPRASPNLAQFAAGDVAMSSVQDLTVRTEPTTGAEALGVLPLNTHTFVVSGPVNADGYDWYEVIGLDRPGMVECPTADRFGCTDWIGWVAATTPEGDRWLEPADPDCPADAPDIETLATMGWAGMFCFGSEPLTMTAFDDPDNYGFGGICNCVAEPDWLYAPFAFRPLSPSADRQLPTVSVRLAPGVEAQWPAELGESLRLTGHFDDPASSSCALRGPDPALDPDGEPWVESKDISVLRCREQFVVTELEVITDG